MLTLPLVVGGPSKWKRIPDLALLTARSNATIPFCPPRHLQLGSSCNATEFSLFDPDRNPIIRRAVAVRNANENYIFWCMPKEITEPRYVCKCLSMVPAMLLLSC